MPPQRRPLDSATQARTFGYGSFDIQLQRAPRQPRIRSFCGDHVDCLDLESRGAIPSADQSFKKVNNSVLFGPSVLLKFVREISGFGRYQYAQFKEHGQEMGRCRITLTIAQANLAKIPHFCSAPGLGADQSFCSYLGQNPTLAAPKTPHTWHLAGRV